MPTPAKQTKLKNAAPTIGQQIDALFNIRESRRELEAKAKDLEAQAVEIEEALMATMHAQGIEKSTGKKASISISSSVVATAVDWDAFNAWIIKTKNIHFYQKRISDPAYREFLDAGKKVPGLEPFVKKRLNLRKVES